MAEKKQARGLVQLLAGIVQELECRDGNGHYCPNCDNGLYNALIFAREAQRQADALSAAAPTPPAGERPLSSSLAEKLAGETAIEAAFREGYDFGQADKAFDVTDAADAWLKSGTRSAPAGEKPKPFTELRAQMSPESQQRAAELTQQMLKELRAAEETALYPERVKRLVIELARVRGALEQAEARETALRDRLAALLKETK